MPQPDARAPGADGLRRRSSRGFALVYVMLMLVIFLAMFLMFLFRGDFNLFSVGRYSLSQQSATYAQAAAHAMATDFMNNYSPPSPSATPTSNVNNYGSVGKSLTQAVADLAKDATGAPIYDSSSAPVYNPGGSGKAIGYHGVKVYDEQGNVLGFADVWCRTNPNAYSGTASLAAQVTDQQGNFSNGFTTVDFHALATNFGRVSRAADEVYNIGGSPSSLNFSYFMSNWAWWAGGGSTAWAQIAGNTGANGNYDILSGSIYGSGGPTATPGTDPTAFQAQQSVRTASSGISTITGTTQRASNTTIQNNYTRISTPIDTNTLPFTEATLKNTASGASYHVNSAGQTVTTPGTISVMTATVTIDSTGNVPRYQNTNPSQPNYFQDTNPGGAYYNPNVSSGELVYQTLNSTGRMAYNPTAPSSSVVTTLSTSGQYPDPNSPSYGSQKSNLVLGQGLPAPDPASWYPYSPGASYSVSIVQITGTVAISGDTVIQGFVQGRGTLYSGRNIYLAGDVNYVNPPSTYPNQVGNGLYGTALSANGSTSATPSGSPASAGTAAAGDYAKDQLMLVAGGSVVEGDVTNYQQWWEGYIPSDYTSYWAVGAQGWLDWTDPVSGANVSAGHNYDYYHDFAFQNAASDRSGTSGFSSKYFDNFPTGVTSYTNFQQNINRVDGFVIADNAIAGLQGDTWNQSTYSFQGGSKIVWFGGQLAKQDAQTCDLWVSGSDLFMSQDQRFRNSPDASLPISNYPRAVLVGWTVP